MFHTSIAHYQITAKLGQGGMGEVYRATDTKLGREVAIKVLPESFARDKERLARFEREARTLATLNHPNIASIHGLEQSGLSQALVLELVEGEDLSSRLKRGPLPLDEALNVCMQIAEALEAAHEKGIIHRDLKPGNIKISDDGKVKVLDFGLAKAVAAESNFSDADSPTITANHTLPGTLLGTAGYMSPEQAKGMDVDKRSDIWSFGVVMWECLTGKRLFAGESVTDSIGAILHKEMDWSPLPSATPPTIQLLLRKCLTRDRKRRLHDIADARVDLEQAVVDPSSSFIQLSETALSDRYSGKRQTHLSWTGLVLLITAITIGAMVFLEPDPPKVPVRRLKVELGESINLAIHRGVGIRYSPDGSTLAYMARNENNKIKQLYLLHRNQLEATPLAGTEGLNDFCFDPEGKHIAFNSKGLKTLRISSGGDSTRLGTVSGIRGLHWGEDGFIYIGGRNLGIRRIPASSGVKVEAEYLTELGKDQESHRHPQLLPGGKAILFTATKSYGEFDDSDIMVSQLPKGKPKIVLKGGYNARCIQIGKKEHLLTYMRQGALYAVRFDMTSMKIKGETVQVISDVMPDSESNVAGHFDISTSGDLVYIKGVKSDPLYELEWLDREGGRRPVKGIGPANYGSFAISPNGKWFAYCVKFRGQSDIMIYDIERELSTNNLTSSTTNETDPVWSPDGSAIAYTMKSREKGAAVYWKALYSTGKPQLLTSDLSRHPAPLSWQGEKLITISDLELQIHTIKGNSQSGWSISTQSKDALTFGGWAAKLSTDGKWLAYASAILGDPQIYVRPTLSGAAPIRISREGGSKPVWSESSQELLFEVNINDDKARVFAVNYQMDGDQFKSDLDAVPWTSDGTFENHWLSTNFDLDPVRQRLLVRKSLEDQSATPIHQVVLIENFFTDLIDKLKLDHD